MTVAYPFSAGEFAWMNGEIEEVDPQSAIHLPLLSPNARLRAGCYFGNAGYAPFPGSEDVARFLA